MKRREYISAFGAIGSATLAGCPMNKQDRGINIENVMEFQYSSQVEYIIKQLNGSESRRQYDIYLEGAFNQNKEVLSYRSDVITTESRGTSQTEVSFLLDDDTFRKVESENSNTEYNKLKTTPFDDFGDSLPVVTEMILSDEFDNDANEIKDEFVEEHTIKNYRSSLYYDWGIYDFSENNLDLDLNITLSKSDGFFVSKTENNSNPEYTKNRVDYTLSKYEAEYRFSPTDIVDILKRRPS